MNRLYKKIYEAIDIGIQKALVLPDEMSDDISVKFSHKKLSNEIDIMNDYVRNLLDGDNPEYYYEQILNYYKEKHKKYKAKDFKELNDIFDKLKRIKRQNMKWLDMSNAISIILDNGQEILFNQFNPNIHMAKFIKLKNNITGHDIILHKDLLTKDNCNWIINYVNKLNFNDIDCISKDKYGSIDKAKQIAYQDYNGYEHTYHNADIELNNRDIKNYPAFKYCMEDLKDIDQKYKAYLPAIGELMFLCDNRYLINYILKKVKGKQINFVNWIWSSTEYAYYGAWFLNNGSTTTGVNTSVGIILPIFTLKNKI